MIRTDWVDSKKDCMENCNIGERYYIMHARGYGSVYQKEHYGYSHTAIENEDCLTSPQEARERAIRAADRKVAGSRAATKAALAIAGREG